MWDINIADQSITFLLAILLGAGFCLLYDVFRIVRRYSRTKKWWTIFLTDLLYFLCAAVLFYCFLLARCVGVIRSYALLGLICGFILCRLTLSPLFLKLADVLVRFLRLLAKPIRVLKQFLLKIADAAGGLMQKILQNTSVRIKKLLKHIRRMMYNHHKKKNEKKKRKVEANETKGKKT